MTRTLALAAIAAACFAPAAPALAAGNLITNGSFETGNFAGWGTQGEATQDTLVKAGTFNNIAPSDGSYQAVMMGGFFSSSGISQTFDTTPGNVYRVTFDIGNDHYNPSNNFRALIDGHEIFSINGIGVIPVLGQVTREFTSIGFVSTLGFWSFNPFTQIDTGGYFHLDNISVEDLGAPPPPPTPGGVPEPGAWALMLAGFFGAGSILRRNRRRWCA